MEPVPIRDNDSILSEIAILIATRKTDAKVTEILTQALLKLQGTGLKIVPLTCRNSR
jgi:hypothetical protein